MWDDAPVDRLSGLDASYLYTESPALHMHTLKISILDVSDVPGGYSFERVKEVLAAHLHLLPPFRRRIVPVPYGLNHPVWIEDEHFDIDQHVRLTRAEAPGGQRQLDAVISRIASTPLDRARPLWEITVVEGLEDGHVAFVAKLHHTAADGVAASALLANVMRLEPGELEPDPPTTLWRPEPVPGKRQLILDALRDLVTTLLRLPGLICRTARNVRRMVLVRREADSDDLPPGAFAGPRTSFNEALTPARSYGSIILPLEDFKLVKTAFGCTINDVVLTLVASSVREYLASRGEPHDEPLVAAVPVSSEAPGTVRLLGNKVSNMFTALRVDIDDPVERLHATSRVTSTAKDLQNALGVETMEQWVEYSPPKPYAWIWHRFVPRLKRPPINAIVSNVPGPKQPLYIAGGKMTGLFSVGPILEGVGLNVTVWSYLDGMNFSAICCPDTLPDVHAITEGLRHALDELVKLAS
jgi:diacylglycerol O-acyltransferase